VAQLIETRDLYTDFYTFEGVVRALNGVSIVVNQGETYGLVGESGCGKSVTVRSMMRIVQSPGRIVSGKILLFPNDETRKQGVDLLERTEAYMTSIRGDQISMIFQEASTSLNPVLSIGDQIGESFFLHRRRQMIEETIAGLDAGATRPGFPRLRVWRAFARSLYRKELAILGKYETDVAWTDDQLLRLDNREGQEADREREYLRRRRDKLREHSRLVRFVKRFPLLRRYNRPLDRTVRGHVVALLRELGVANPERIAAGYPHELSGGMQQRIVIAIALACHPLLLIADEPTSNLDVTIQAQILDLVKHLKESSISSVLFITHDLGLVAEMCDRASVMYAGDVCETAGVGELFENPLHPYTRGLLESVPKVASAGELRTIPGVVPGLVDPPSGCRFHPRCPSAMPRCSAEKPPTVEIRDGHSVACYLYTDGTT
jgi:peptide/nickel transport system ATP-binding protein